MEGLATSVRSVIPLGGVNEVSVELANRPTSCALATVLVIDGLEGNLYDAEHTPFMFSLLEGQGGRAAYYPQSESVLPAETNPNHTAMMSGSP